MGRIALFVAVVGGLAYLLIRLVAGPVLGLSVSPLVAISLSVILAVVLWTALMVWAADRLGRKRDEP